jgi:heptosyltransferase II
MPQHLIVRLRNWVGDVVLSTPSLVALENAGYTLTLVGKPWAKNLFAGYSWDIFTKPQSLISSVEQLKSIRTRLKQLDNTFEHRTNSLIYPTSFSSALEMRMAGLHALGYSQEMRSFLLHQSIPITYGGHALKSYWELTQTFLTSDLQAPLNINLKISSDDQQAADTLLEKYGIKHGFVCIVPFAGGTFEKLDKRWPNFPAFSAALKDTQQTQVICPGPNEEEIATKDYPHAISMKKVNLGIYLGLIRRAKLVVSNDTGPAHMAAAVGTTVLSVLGPTKAEQWAPWGSDVHIIQSYPVWPSVHSVLEETKQILLKN